MAACVAQPEFEEIGMSNYSVTENYFVAPKQIILNTSSFEAG